MLIYIHVPFCLTRCKYCAFYSLPIGRKQIPAESPAVMSYVDHLLQEVRLWGQRLGQVAVSSIFWGGGTPSLLPISILGKILEQLHQCFKIASQAEITLEVNPEAIAGPLQGLEYLKLGFNRLSMGVQSLDADLLHMLGRRHKAQDSINALKSLKEAGWVNVGVDLMWGLPRQSIRQWLYTLKEIVRLEPMHISAYGLTLEEGTPLAKSCALGNLHLPPERDQNTMFLDGAAFLQSEGYLHYEISNFARMGYQCRHNMGYWHGEDYLGLGPSATSTLNNKRWTNPANLKDWEAQVTSGDIGQDEEELTPLLKVLEMLMLSLRTSRGLELKKYQLMTGHDFLRDHQPMIQALHENGLIRLMNGYMRLTTSGMLVSNAILANLFERTKQILPRDLPHVEEKGDPTQLAEQNKSAAIRKVVWPRIDEL
ncbi:MAG: radical SAM family heme chaperone HemW [Desulfovibrionaceae bacterium]|nr:radical SAM family heme chaperone HemW [Desulfovibrionaceae bacterium]